MDPTVLIVVVLTLGGSVVSLIYWYIYKMGRLSWLDSTKGIDETVTDGFAPVAVSRKGGGLADKTCTRERSGAL